LASQNITLVRVYGFNVYYDAVARVYMHEYIRLKIRALFTIFFRSENKMWRLVEYFYYIKDM